MSEKHVENKMSLEDDTLTQNIIKVSGSCNLGEFNSELVEFDVFLAKLEQYFISTDEDDDKKKAAILLTKLSYETFKLLRDLLYPKEVNKASYKEICDLLISFYGKPVSIFSERKKFYDIRQHENETINEWYSRVKSSASSCLYGNQLSSVLVDKFITGINSAQIFDRLCEEDETITLARAKEIAVRKEITTKNRTTELNKINTNRSNTHTQQEQQRFNRQNNNYKKKKL